MRRIPRIGPNTALLLAGLVLPNALSLATLFHLIDIGLPPRPFAVALYVILAVCARRVPFALTVTLYAVVLIHDLVCTLSLMFGLAPLELFTALRFAARIRIFESPLYAALAVVLLANSAAILWLLKGQARLLRGNVLLLAGVATAFAAADYASNTSPYFSFGSMLGRNRPVVSAGEASGFNTIAGKNGRNVVVIVIESLGYLADPRACAMIASPLNAAAIRARVAQFTHLAGRGRAEIARGAGRDDIALRRSASTRSHSAKACCPRSSAPAAALFAGRAMPMSRV